MAARNQLTFCTYNANNFDAVKYDFAKEMFPKCDFLLLQETWHTETEFIRKLLENY